ncbi:OsmC family protein [Christiangramia sabulilitoris]|uniref:OsmC family protein n=1 Tax=Christiangramia sabulilitoris TaxID=2583991 RepID=A0A550I2T4_9FLAO|nr:OsmC family protein [Christiangramia sabulilitoris]TRO65275.1 OsmC family protein [Christiangramia sabulilitoris]
MTSKVKYLGDLRTESEHLQSGSKVITDAPVDNHGKGEAFSPTDMVANSLATCMLTIMGIKAESMGLVIKGTSAEVTKVMAAEPRRIAQIEINIKFPEKYSEKEAKILENAALNCPVFHSLHPDIEKNISFTYS